MRGVDVDGRWHFGFFFAVKVAAIYRPYELHISTWYEECQIVFYFDSRGRLGCAYYGSSPGRLESCLYCYLANLSSTIDLTNHHLSELLFFAQPQYIVFVHHAIKQVATQQPASPGKYYLTLSKHSNLTRSFLPMSSAKGVNRKFIQ